jgi:alkylhydroperoxidase family enzyme
MAMAATDAQQPAASMVSIQGEIVLRTPDAKQKQIVYLRVRDESGRVWIMAAHEMKTAIMRDGLKVTLQELREGAHVAAEFPRNADVPLATSLMLMPATPPAQGM